MNGGEKRNHQTDWHLLFWWTLLFWFEESCESSAHSLSPMFWCPLSAAWWTSAMRVTFLVGVLWWIKHCERDQVQLFPIWITALSEAGCVRKSFTTYACLFWRSKVSACKENQQARSSLGRDLQHLMERGCRTRFLFPLKNPDFVCRKCPEADTCGQGHCVMEKHSDRPVCSKISPACA